MASPVVDWCSCRHGSLLKRRWEERNVDKRTLTRRDQAIESLTEQLEREMGPAGTCSRCHGFGLVGPIKLVAYKARQLEDEIEEAQRMAKAQTWLRRPGNEGWEEIIEHLEWPEDAVMRKLLIEGKKVPEIADEMGLDKTDVYDMRYRIIRRVEKARGEIQHLGDEPNLRAHLDSLPPIWAEVLSHRYGIHGGLPQRSEEIAERFEETKLWVRQIEKAAFSMIHLLEQGYSQEEALAVVEAVMVADSNE